MRTYEKLVSDKGLAEDLRVTPDWLAAEVAAGRLPAIVAEGPRKGQTRLLFDRELVLQILLERSRGKEDDRG